MRFLSSFKHRAFGLMHLLHGDRMIAHYKEYPKVLFYHGVAQRIEDPLIEIESIDEASFIKHLNYLKRYYNVISIEEFSQRYAQQRWEGNEILLTFDDGYKNILTTGLPLLEQYRFPFVQFFTTNNITTGDLFPTTINRLVIIASSVKTVDVPVLEMKFDLSIENRSVVCEQISRKLKTMPLEMVNQTVHELQSNLSIDELESLKEKYSSIMPMNWEEAKQLANNTLCSIGSHGLDHICCHDRQQPEEVYRQIVASKQVIEEKLDLPCNYFSYPNGNYTDYSNWFVESAGYELGFSTKRLKLNTLTRWNIPRMYTPYDFTRYVYSLVTYP